MLPIVIHLLDFYLYLIKLIVVVLKTILLST